MIDTAPLRYILYIKMVLTLRDKIGRNMTTRDEITRQLSRAGLRPSAHRARVLAYLQEHRIHPTIDTIYTALRQSSARLSRSTVYNVLRAFTEAGLVTELDIDGVQARYDINTVPHGHFQCRRCGAVVDFDVNIELLPDGQLSGYHIDDRAVFFKGLCPACQE